MLNWKPGSHAILLCATLIAALNFPATALAAELPLELAEARIITVDSQRQFEGTVEAINKTTVSAQTSGRITYINFDVDDFVEQGAVILRFSDSEHKARLDQASSTLAAAMARAKAAEQEYERVSKLYKNGTVAKARFDQAKSANDASAAQAQNARAAVDQAREQLGYTIVKAPYSGLVVERHVEIGEIANPGKPLMTGFSLEQLRVRSEVPEQFAQLIRESNVATVIPGTGDSIAIENLTVFPFADPKSNTVTIRLALPEGIKSVFPGMLVKTRFKIGETKVLAVPEIAIARRGEVTGVYLVDDDDNVALQQVRTGREMGNGMIQILTGLKDKDKIALDPLKAAIYLKKNAGETK